MALEGMIWCLKNVLLAIFKMNNSKPVLLASLSGLNSREFALIRGQIAFLADLCFAPVC